MRSLAVLLGAIVIAAPFAAADPPPKPADKPKAETVHEVPYRLTDTKHVLVRLKLNGKGGQPVYVKLAGQTTGRCAPR